MNGGRWLVTFCAWMAGALAGTLALYLLTSTARWLAEGMSVAQVMVAEAVRFAFPVAGALLFARWARTWSLAGLAGRLSARRVRVLAIALVLGLYLATWAFGVPAVTTHLVRRDIDAYKRAYSGKDKSWWERYPSIRSAFGAPVLPGLVVVYYESQSGGQWGGGAWYLFAWWGTGERELSASWRWLS